MLQMTILSEHKYNVYTVLQSFIISSHNIAVFYFSLYYIKLKNQLLLCGPLRQYWLLLGWSGFGSLVVLERPSVKFAAMPLKKFHFKMNSCERSKRESTFFQALFVIVYRKGDMKKRCRSFCRYSTSTDTDPISHITLHCVSTCWSSMVPLTLVLVKLLLKELKSIQVFYVAWSCNS